MRKIFIIFILFGGIVMFSVATPRTYVDSNFKTPKSFFHSLNRGKRYVTYPAGTAIGLLVAIALPVEVPEENLYFSLNFEANYNLPDNITQYYNSDIARVLHTITRRSAYSLLEDQISRHGYDGEECLLRMICEISKREVAIVGLLDAVLNVIFRPSSTRNESLPWKYFEAERAGIADGDCYKVYGNCETSLLDLISIMEQS